MAASIKVLAIRKNEMNQRPCNSDDLRGVEGAVGKFSGDKFRLSGAKVDVGKPSGTGKKICGGLRA